MKLKLNKGHAASMMDINLLERKLGAPLPPQFTDFVRLNSGSEPESNIFQIGAGNDSGVNQFIPVSEIATEMLRIENLPQRSFPIAWAEGGNYVFINLAAGGATYFWDHEEPGNIVRLADNFLSFLELLEPLDVSTIKLKPGQVKQAWIDSDFFKSLE